MSTSNKSERIIREYGLTISHIKNSGYSIDKNLGDDNWFFKRVNDDLEVCIIKLASPNYEMFTRFKNEFGTLEWGKKYDVQLIDEFEVLNSTLSQYR